MIKVFLMKCAIRRAGRGPAMRAFGSEVWGHFNEGIAGGRRALAFQRKAINGEDRFLEISYVHFKMDF
jgi:hypothetical protein